MPGLCTGHTGRSRSRLVKAAGSFPIIKLKLPSADPCGGREVVWLARCAFGSQLAANGFQRSSIASEEATGKNSNF
jgi:hypothetical protein